MTTDIKNSPENLASEDSFTLPKNFYVGTEGGDSEDVATSRKDRERGFTRRLREAREEAREKCDTAREQELTKTLLQAYAFFKKQRLAGGDFPDEKPEPDRKDVATSKPSDFFLKSRPG